MAVWFSWFNVVFLVSCTLTLSSASYQHFTKNSCNSAFGLENEEIKDDQLSANSYTAYMYFPGKGTHNAEAKYGRLNGRLAWCGLEGRPGYREDPYIQVDFGQIVDISGLAIQGLKTVNSYYVKTYTVKFSLDGSHWFNYGSPHNKVWQGSSDANSINRVFFSNLVRARYLQLLPRSSRRRICLRMEIYGCYINKTENGTRSSTISTLQPTTTLVFQPSNLLSTLHQSTPISILQPTTPILILQSPSISTSLQPTSGAIIPVLQPSTTLPFQPSSISTLQSTCNSAFGLENGEIKDDQLSANSYIAYMYFPGKGTYNAEAKYGRLNGPLAWCGLEGKPGYREDPYIQVDFGQIVDISGLAIQGLKTVNSYYVKIYTVKFSLDGSHWFNYGSPHKKVWQGSSDANTINRVFFSNLVRARYLQLLPRSSRYRICLRMEIYGCYINKTENGTRSSTISNLQPTTTLVFQPSNLLSTLHQSTPILILQSRSISTSLQPTSGAIIPVLQPSTTLPFQPSSISTSLQPTTDAIIPVLQPSTTLPFQPSSISTRQSTCNSAFGLENGEIKDDQLSANSYTAYMYFPGKGRYNAEAKYGRLNGRLAWCGLEGKPGYREDPYIQVDFGQIVDISGLAIQGLKTVNSYYVKTYTVKFSLDGSHWFNYGSPHNKVWQGSSDANTINRVFFSNLVRARYLQLLPRSSRYRICLRMEIYGCYINKTENGTRSSTISTLQPTTTLVFLPSNLLSTLHQPTTVISILQPTTPILILQSPSISTSLQPTSGAIIPVLQPSTTLPFQPSSISTLQSTCNSAFGLENGEIKDDQLSANSYIAYMYFPGKGTYNAEAKYGRLNGPLAWCGLEGKPGYREDPYIQVDFGQIVDISGLAIQGLKTFVNSYYVKTYTVKFSLDGSLWFNYGSPHNKVWQGSSDANTINRVFFSNLVRARYLQLLPRSSRYRICLRMEIYGCYINKTENGTRSSTISTLQPTTTLVFQPSNLLSTLHQPTTVISILQPTTPILILQSPSISTSLQPTSGAIIPVLQPTTALAFQPSSISTSLQPTTDAIIPVLQPSTTLPFQPSSISTSLQPTTDAIIPVLQPSTTLPFQPSSISTRQSTCNSAFGLENGEIKDDQLSANSYIAYMYFPGKGTHNAEAKYGRLNGRLAWCGLEGKPGYREDPYIQVDFGQIVDISGLAIQGLKTVNSYYVKTYTVKFSLDGSHWFNYGSPHNKVWQGSSDANTINRVFFSNLVRARYLQLIPRSSRYRICLRMEIYGCYINKTVLHSSTVMKETSKHRVGTVFLSTMTSPDLAPSSISTNVTSISSARLASSRKTGSKKVLIMFVCIALAMFAAFLTVIIFLVLKKRKRNEHSRMSEFHVLNPRSSLGKTVESISYIPHECGHSV